MKDDIRKHTMYKRHNEQNRVVSWPRIALFVVAVFLAILTFHSETKAAQAWDTRYDSEYKNDYIGHYVTGFVAGPIIYVLLPDTLNFKPYLDVEIELNKWSKTAIAVGLPMVVKGAFEIFDDGADFRDVLEVGLGASIGSGAVLFYQWRF